MAADGSGRGHAIPCLASLGGRGVSRGLLVMRVLGREGGVRGGSVVDRAVRL
jgi:hypothetical protein